MTDHPAAGLYAPNRARGRFFNPWAPFTQRPRDLWKFLTAANGYRRKARVPIPQVANDGAELRGVQHSSRITWVGHATTIIHDGADVLLTDPHFGPRALLPARANPPGVPLSAIPAHAMAVLSHNHYDHLDEHTVMRLPATVHWFVPTGLADWFRARGRHRVTELGWWESAQAGAWRIHCVPAQHWSRRIGQDTNTTLWCGWVMQSADYSYYYAGDTGYFRGFREIGQRFGPVDVALLPIGAYQPRWFMRYQHMDPEEALRAFEDLGARYMIPVHWGTFDLAHEDLHQPPLDLQAAMRERDTDPARVRILAIGEGWHLPHVTRSHRPAQVAAAAHSGKIMHI